MKYIFIILFLFSGYTYSQIVSDKPPTIIDINKTDNDSLWQDFKYMFPEIEKDNYRIYQTDTDFIFSIGFACRYEDMPKPIREKILTRLIKKGFIK